MSVLYLQSGWGHHTRVGELDQASGIDVGGVILSPQHLSENRIYDAALSSPGEVLLDPQTYVYSIPDAVASRHDDHDLVASIDVNSPARVLSEVVDQVLELNRRLELGRVIAPAPLMSGFMDPWSQLGASLLATTVDMAPDARLLATVAVDVAAFSSWEDVELWLDRFTRSDVDGVYLVVANESPYPPAWDPGQLAAILRFIYRLSQLNGYQVLWGYSDLAGLLGLAAGGTGLASGWFYGMRRFSRSTWIPSRGGRQPTPRVTVPDLFSPVRADFVTPGWEQAGALQGLGHGARQQVLQQHWELADAWPQHLGVLSAVASELAALEQPARVLALRDRLAHATEGVDALEERGVATEPGLRARLAEFAQALDLFAELEGIR